RRENLDLWREIDGETARFRNIAFEWVQGHNGDQYNEMADRLANRGLRGEPKTSQLEKTEVNALPDRKKKEQGVLVRHHKTFHGVGRTSPSIRTNACPLCLGLLQETTQPAGKRCPTCLIWARKDHVVFGVRF
ncbi:MAG TPA: RNase H family protein, partial [Candidatus Binataceae bacterium]|nr:RNase H family protein [Candidatus Binataceae bacterium]